METRFYDITPDGSGYIFDDGTFMPISSDVDGEGGKVLRTHRVVELEGIEYVSWSSYLPGLHRYRLFPGHA